MHSAISPQQTHTSACSRTHVLFNNWGKLWKPVTVFKSAVMGVLFKVLKESGQSLAEVALWVNAEPERVRAGGFPSPNSSPQRRKKGGARGNRTHTHTHSCSTEATVVFVHHSIPQEEHLTSSQGHCCLKGTHSYFLTWRFLKIRW